MTYFDQEQFDIRCEWSMAGVEGLSRADVMIIVDVLSFSTSVDVALGRGGIVWPYRWKDASAIEYARERSAELAGVRAGVRGEEGGRYSLSPSSLIDAPAGLRLVLPSPNGSSLAFAAKAGGAVVVAGCLRNASAVARWAGVSGKRINVIPAGERWPDGSLRPAVEDLIGAGAIIRKLSASRSPEAQAAVDAFEGAKGSIVERVVQCVSGLELIERGFARDVEIASAIDVSEVVPVLKDDAFVPATAIGKS